MDIIKIQLTVTKCKIAGRGVLLILPGRVKENLQTVFPRDFS